MKTNFCAILTILIFTTPTFASVNVSTPSNGESVSSPFTLSASATECSSQPIASMAYSLDNGSDITTVYKTSMDVQVSSGTGAHTVHVKSWGDKGASCVTDVAVTVISDGGVSIPSDAVSVSSIQTLGGWSAEHDTGISGNANGKMYLVGSPSHSGTTRELVTSYSGAGGERYAVTFGDNTSSTNFVYDGWVYLNSSASNVANLEMDMNQVMPNGQTVIFGFQCDGWKSTWDYTENVGTPEKPVDTWIHSKAYCNPRGWSRETWHHVQVEYSRTDTGKVTYEAVWLDGLKSTLNVTVPSAFALGWGPSLSTNFQVDGLGSSGTNQVFLDDVTVYRW